MVVYFIQGEHGPIKIGISQDVAGRLVDLQRMNYAKLTLVASFNGGAKEERRLHYRFWDDHLRGEWFQGSEALLDFIAAAQEHGRLPELEEAPACFNLYDPDWKVKLPLTDDEFRRELGLAFDSPELTRRMEEFDAWVAQTSTESDENT